jgi:hypothetical protein
MPAAELTAQELEAYREQADRFTAERDEEWYQHLSGRKEGLDLEAIYERHADLTTLDRALVLGAAAAEDPALTELWKFACSGYLEALTREQQEKLAMLETELQAKVNGESIGYRMLRPTIANSEDRSKREELERARCELEDEHLNPVYLETAQIERQAVRELGAPSYAELHRRFGFRLDELGEQCRTFLDSTEKMYEQAADRLFRQRIGIGLDQVGRWDVPRLFRANQWDEGFPADRMLPALEGTLEALGVDIRSQPNVVLDVEQRKNKSPRAFCAPIEVPGRVVLVIQPIGGADDWRALFHEAGHTEHFACTSPDLLVEERKLGDNAVTEGWAMTLEHLTINPPWLERLLSFPRPSEFAAEGLVSLLYLFRRYCGKLLYELELGEADDVTAMKPRYVEILSNATKIEPSPTSYLSDVDGGYYVTEYLRAWAFESQMYFFLCERFGRDWSSKREAGSLLRELWSLGQKPTADELLTDVTGSEIRLEAVADRVAEAVG